MISELGGQIGSYVADLIGTDIKMHGTTTSMGPTIGALYNAERVPNDAAPHMVADTFDNLIKSKPSAQPLKR